MSRTQSTFSMLQAIAAIAGLAILLWSLGLPSIRFAEADNLTTISDTLSDSTPSVGSNHTIVFTTPTGLTAGQEIVITFPDGASDFDLSTIGAEDIDLASSTGDYSLQNGAAAGETWGVSTSTFDITLVSGTATLDANATITIEIGSNALFDQPTGHTQITNPTTGSYEITVDLGPVGGPYVDSGATRVAIVPNVTVSASVDTEFTFSVAGTPRNTTVNGTSTGASTTPTEVNFGNLDAGTASTGAQRISVVTNAKNGFTVTVVSDGQLDSATGADIDGFSNGSYQPTPLAWEPPTASPGVETTYGHWGITSDDTDIFATEQTYVSASTSPVSVLSHNGPGDGTGSTTALVGYTVQISALQEAADDYEATIMYIATPVF